MAYIRVEYSSPANIGVQGVDYFEVEEDELDENGQVPERVCSQVWQDAVNEFMTDTSATVVDQEGE